MTKELPILSIFNLFLTLSLVLLSSFQVDAQQAVTPDQFTIAEPETNETDPESLLPLELASFTGFSKGCLNILSWKTQVEVNTNYFIVLHSSNGQIFTPIDAVAAAGTSIQLNQYSNSYPSSYRKTYYRLKTVDINGETTLSDIIVVSSPCQFLLAQMSIAPNPNFGNVQFSFVADKDRSIQLEISDAQGRTVRQLDIDVISGLNMIDLDTHEFGAGLYFLHVKGSSNQPLKFIKAE